MRFQVMLALAALAAGCSPQAAKPPQTADAPPAVAAPTGDDPPLTANGVYIDRGACPGEGCYLGGKIKAYEAVDLFDKPGPNASVTGKIAAREWVDVVTTEDWLIPVRGVVRNGKKSFATGDVVYRLGSEGEGCFKMFSKGKPGSWCDPEAGDPETNEVIDWQDPSQDLLKLEALWVNVKRADGSTGWLKDVREFGCTGYQDRDSDCPPLPQ